MGETGLVGRTEEAEDEVSAKDAERQVRLVRGGLEGARTCLATAGAALIGTRQENGTGSALITAMRDDITAMLSDLATLERVLRGEVIEGVNA